MNTTLQFDEDASRRLEAVYMTPDVVAQRRRVRDALKLSAGEDVLDVGSGPGLLAAEMAAAVGPSGSVRGVDVSDSMLAIASARTPPEDAAPMEFVAASAESLPFRDGSFDVAVSTQVYEYVEDVPRAVAELHRVLRQGGRVAILDTDWDSIVCHSRDRERTERVLAAWEEHLVDARLPRRLRGMLDAGGFGFVRCEAVPMFNFGYQRNTFSAGIVAMIAEFVSGRGGIGAEEAAAWRADVVELGEDYFFSLNRYLFTAVRAQAPGASGTVGAPIAWNPPST
jgi:SAM-dependent methyltransferase